MYRNVTTFIGHRLPILFFLLGCIHFKVFSQGYIYIGTYLLMYLHYTRLCKCIVLPAFLMICYSTTIMSMIVLLVCSSTTTILGNRDSLQIGPMQRTI